MTCTLLPAAVWIALAAPPATPGADVELFSTQVAPLLRDHCARCHNAQTKRGGLDMTTRTALLRGGDEGPVLVPGNAGKSRLLDMVSGVTPRMPRQGKPLTPQQVATLRRWIEGGATWPDGVELLKRDWWSLAPLTRPAVPAVKDAAWVRTPVDAFVLARLEQEGLKPSPEADRATLLRRATFDLHGLPPTPAEIDAFVADKSPDAWEKVVDRLLASPRYGERWGRHWLDLAHYADTHGYDKDKRRDHAWPYRDYVIRALNQDRPYARFIKEQLAGDVLAPDDPDAVAATGFLAAGPWDFVGQVELREGTVDKDKTRLLDRDDLVSSTAATFLGLTVGCARCHDHKFDPIPQVDYYRLQAVFAGVERGDRPLPDSRRRDLLSRRARHETEQKEVVARREAGNPELTRLDAELKAARAELASLPARGGPSPSNGYHSNISPVPDVVKWVQVDLGKVVPLDAVRLLPARPTDFADTPGFGFPVRFRIEAANDPAFREPVRLIDHSAADFANPGDTAFVVRPDNVRARYIRVTATRLWKRTNDYVFALAELEVDSGGRNVARNAVVTALDSIEAGRWARRYLVDGSDSRRVLPLPGDADGARRAAVEERLRDLEKRRKGEADRLLTADDRAVLTRLAGEQAAIDRELQALPPSQVYGVVSRAPRPIYLLHRGDVEQKRAEMTPGALSCVPGLEADFRTSPGDEGARRVALAAWIADPRNPLPWRAAVNRVWHDHFGRALADTPADLGRNGSLPTHPELLDWLAVEFRDHDGSFKHLHRLLLTSAVYRQASQHNEAAARVDGDNRLLWRMNRTRLDAESVRDAVLAVSGALDLRAGGPGFEPFRFKDDHSPIYDHTDPLRALDPSTYRRSVYRFTVRSVPHPFLDCLDGADPNLNTPVRNTTLTALQALALLNDPFMVRQSELFAGRLARVSSDPVQQADEGFRLVVGRRPTAGERDAWVGYARKHGLANACRLLLNLNEFVFVD